MPFDTSGPLRFGLDTKACGPNDSKEDELADCLAESSSIAGRLCQPRKYSGITEAPYNPISSRTYFTAGLP
jgi:hypothetical protein